jgi:hypothetical protein
MLPSFASDTVTRVRPVWTTDARGTRRPDYGPAAGRVALAGCLVQPGASQEVLDNRVGAVAVRWSVFMPAGTDIEASDGVEVDGRLYAVDGEPARHKSPTGALSHVLVLLVDWKG